ncbi:MAG TPA: sulfatase [Phycisphaerae bacterium]|nr:sulfatase [Phycisphaerae bacterium]
MKRREALKMLGVGASALTLPRWMQAAGSQPGGPAGRPRPNFIVIFCDDLGYADVGCYGAKDIRTPNIDRMAKEGVRFRSFYVAASVCSPSRAALLTGCYPIRTGVTRVLFPQDKNGLSHEKKTVAEILKGRGYATACIGKWHLGTSTQAIRGLPQHAEFMPTNRGFDMYFGIPYSNDMKPTPLVRGTETLEEPVDQDTLTQRYTAESIKFIEANKDRPFLLYLPHTMPHVPLHASEAFRGKSARGLYGDVVEELDWSTGRILETLQRLGLDKNTLVVFTSDNGPWLAQGKAGGSAGPLRDGKFSNYEGGIRMPAIFWWPGRIQAGWETDFPASTMDLLPTLAALAGAPVPQGLDGCDIGGYLLGGPSAKPPRECLLVAGIVRQGPWKLRASKELYNLDEDIGEKNNLADKMPEKVKELQALAAEAGNKGAGGARPKKGKPE